MAKPTIEINMQFKPDSEDALKKLTENLEKMNQLLAENRDLLTQFIQRSLEFVEPALGGTESVGADGESSTT